MEKGSVEFGFQIANKKKLFYYGKESHVITDVDLEEGDIELLLDGKYLVIESYSKGTRRVVSDNFQEIIWKDSLEIGLFKDLYYIYNIRLEGLSIYFMYRYKGESIQVEVHYAGNNWVVKKEGKKLNWFLVFVVMATLSEGFRTNMEIVLK